jgi:sugar lactone lactonase YvrE
MSARFQRLRELVGGETQVEQVASGFVFTEGPIWTTDGALQFSDIPADRRWRWHPRDGVAVVREPSNKSNGMTGPRGVWVFAPDGAHLGAIDVPESVANLNWGGDEWSTLYIAASTSIYRAELKVGGNRLGYMR